MAPRLYQSIFVKIMLLAVGLLFQHAAIAQPQYSHWYFGGGAGVRFTKDSAYSITDSKIIASEGCAGISDRNGNLLFYTDGITVYNALHEVVPGGNGLWGNPSTTQVALIVPYPKHPNQWFIFTADANFAEKGLCYTHIQMDFSGHSGLILDKNVPVLTPVAEKLTATQHANGRDFWLVTHGAGNNRYHSFLIDSNGVHRDVSVTSDVGISHTVTWNAANAVGGIKISPDGKKMAAAILGENAFELYDFDAATGKVSNAITLQDSVKFANAYSVEFSPDSRILYLSATGYKKVHQIFLQGNTAEKLLENAIEIPFSQTEGNTSLQLGPDGKLYIGRAGDYLSAIAFPTALYPNCLIEERSVDLKGKFCYLGLPNNFHFEYVPNFRFENTCEGDSALFSITTPAFDSAVWDFGEGNMLNMQSKTAKHQYSETGKYKVKLYLYMGGVLDSTEKELQYFPHKKTVLPADTIICAKVALSLSAFDSTYVSYLWSNGAPTPALSVSETGIYWVSTFDGNCFDSDTIKVNFKQSPVVDLGKDTFICEPDEIILSLPQFGSSAFNWQNNSADTFFTVKLPGQYFVQVKNECGMDEDSIEVATCECTVFVPSAFSPDQNGLNDLFRAEGCLPVLFKLSVFNSWGERVFFTDDITKGWDGTFKGQSAPEGVYAWVLEYAGSARSDQLNKADRGTVILMR